MTCDWIDWMHINLHQVPRLAQEKKDAASLFCVADAVDLTPRSAHIPHVHGGGRGQRPAVQLVRAPPSPPPPPPPPAGGSPPADTGRRTGPRAAGRCTSSPSRPRCHRGLRSGCAQSARRGTTTGPCLAPPTRRCARCAKVRYTASLPIRPPRPPPGKRSSMEPPIGLAAAVAGGAAHAAKGSCPLRATAGHTTCGAPSHSLQLADIY